MTLRRLWIGVVLATTLGCQNKHDARDRVTRSQAPLAAGVPDAAARTVSVEGIVDKVYDPRAFVLHGDGVVWPARLIVMTRTPVEFGPSDLAEQQDVVVTGALHAIRPGELESVLGRTLDPAFVKDHRDEPIVVAEAARLIDTEVTWSKDHPLGAITSAGRLFSDEDRFAGQIVDLANVAVQEVGTHGIWVGTSSRSEMFVLPTDETTLAGIAIGDGVAIVGVALKIPARVDVPAHLDEPRARDERVYIVANQLSRVARRPGS